MLEREHFEEFRTATQMIVRALVSGSYRRRMVTVIPKEGWETDQQEDEETGEAHPAGRPYFEVLIVDNLTSAQERAQSHSLTHMRRPEDPFVYEPVVVSSLEDALIAVLFNLNLQAVVVRFGFELKSRNPLNILHRYLTRLGDEDIERIEPDDYGPERWSDHWLDHLRIAGGDHGADWRRAGRCRIGPARKSKSANKHRKARPTPLP